MSTDRPQDLPHSTVAVDEDAIADHLERFFEAADNEARSTVFSSVLGGIHLYCFAPSKKLQRNFWTIVTMGISGTRMDVPDNIHNPDEWCRCELMCYLPPDWKMPLALGGPADDHSWPLEMLRSMGMYVARTGAWLGNMHGLPSMVDAERPGAPFVPGSKLTHCILLEPVDEDEDFSQLVLPATPTSGPGHGVIVAPGDRSQAGLSAAASTYDTDVSKCDSVNFYLVIPLTTAEAQWKREVGAEQSIFYMVGSNTEGGNNIAVDYIINTHRLCAVDDLGFRAQVEAELEEQEQDVTESESESESESDGADDDEGDDEVIGGDNTQDRDNEGNDEVTGSENTQDRDHEGNDEVTGSENTQDRDNEGNDEVADTANAIVSRGRKRKIPEVDTSVTAVLGSAVSSSAAIELPVLEAAATIVVVRLAYVPVLLVAMEDMLRATVHQTRSFAGNQGVEIFHFSAEHQFVLVQKWRHSSDYASYMQWRSGAGSVAGFVDLLQGGMEGLSAKVIDPESDSARSLDLSQLTAGMTPFYC